MNNKWLLISSSALCLALAGCGNNGPHGTNDNGYYNYSGGNGYNDNNPGNTSGDYNGYPDSGTSTRIGNTASTDTAMNTQETDNAERGKMHHRHDHMDGNARYWFNEIDRGHKGYITKADMRMHAMDKFHEMDANHDGRVTFEEFMEFKHHEFDNYRTHYRNEQ